jgi:hypothetical protein
MEYVIRSKLFREDEITILNYCRQFLHVTTVSELFDASGKKLLPHIINCSLPPWNDPNQYRILQHRPSNHQIRHKWLKLLSVFAHKNFTPKPFIKFGMWTHIGIRLRTRRESYFCPTSMRLYHWHSTLTAIGPCYLPNSPQHTSSCTRQQTGFRPTVPTQSRCIGFPTKTALTVISLKSPPAFSMRRSFSTRFFSILPQQKHELWRHSWHAIRHHLDRKFGPSIWDTIIASRRMHRVFGRRSYPPPFVKIHKHSSTTRPPG